MIDYKDIASWSGAALGTLAAAAAAVGFRKADNAVPKDEFREFAKETRETMKLLFQNAENDRKQLHECVDRLDDKIHELHIKVLERK